MPQVQVAMIVEVSIAVLGSLILWYCFYQSSALDCPPGPKPLPIVGNIRDLPLPGQPEFQHWLRFKDAYGPVSSISIFGQRIVVIHDRDAAHFILEKSSAKTSGRPYLTFLLEISGHSHFFSLRGYDASFRRQRKMLHQQMGTRTIAAQFQAAADVESRRFLLRVLNQPEKIFQHIQAETAAIILNMTYGYTIDANKPDPLVNLIARMMQNFSLAAVPMSWIVDIFPVLKHLPEGFPGAAFKKTGREWKSIVKATMDLPYIFVKNQMTMGIHQTSYVSSLIEEHKDEDSKEIRLRSDDDIAIKETAGAMYTAGSDTLVAALTSFVLAMILYPDIQKKAQREIDSIVGSNRLPDFSDQSKLEYTNAVAMETLRWLPVVPMGVTHVADEEMVYSGFRIPKGSYICPSIWWFLHDSKTYSDPSSFKPDRYLEPLKEPDPAAHAFGYGRRVCPGKYVTADNIFINISRILAVFDITNAVDNEGRIIEVKLEPQPGLICKPKPFTCSFKPRSATASALIQSVEQDYPWKKGDAGVLLGLIGDSPDAPDPSIFEPMRWN